MEVKKDRFGGRNALTGINRILTGNHGRCVRITDLCRNALTGINRILTNRAHP